MTQTKDTISRRKFQHLRLDERGEIKALLGEGYGVTVIAQRLNRNKSTISREIKRGTVKQLNSDLTERTEYYADTGEMVYTRNRKRSQKPLKATWCVEFLAYGYL